MDALFKKAGMFLLFTLVIGGRIWQFPRGFRQAIEEVRIMEERSKPGGRPRFPVRDLRSGSHSGSDDARTPTPGGRPTGSLAP